VAMAVLGLLTLWAGIASWRRNSKAGLHGHDRSAPPGAAIDEQPAPGVPDVTGDVDEVRGEAPHRHRRRRRRPADAD
jgi:hypothetical protein